MEKRSPVAEISEERYERMVNHMHDGVLMLNDAGEVISANEAARRILGLPRDEALAPAVVVHRVLGFDPLETLRAAGRPLRMDFWVQGVPYQAELASSGDDDDGSGCVIAFRNVREERRLDQMKSELIHVASHELRTPLTAIRNALSLLRSGRAGEATKQQRHFLDLAGRNVEHLMEMIGDLLDSAKLESGTAQIEKEPLDLGAVIAATVESLSPQAETNAIEITLELDAELPTVYGKASMLERVLINLIGNAIKFTPKGGAVLAGARKVGGPSEPSIHVTVADTGPGIPPDELHAIFDRFHQVGRARGHEVAGTGLGLAIARELVEAHHGRIWAENAPDGGARFVFTVPVLTEDEFFLQQLEREIDRARRIPMPLALVVVRVDDPAALRERVAEAEFAEILEKLSSVAEATAYRSSDRIQVLNERVEIAATLLDTPRPGGLAFARRLAETLNETLDICDARFVSGCATFPEEAVTAGRLYGIARSAEAR